MPPASFTVAPDSVVSDSWNLLLSVNQDGSSKDGSVVLSTGQASITVSKYTDNSVVFALTAKVAHVPEVFVAAMMADGTVVRDLKQVDNSTVVMWETKQAAGNHGVVRSIVIRKDIWNRPFLDAYRRLFRIPKEDWNSAEVLDRCWDAWESHWKCTNKVTLKGARGGEIGGKVAFMAIGFADVPSL